MIQPQQHIVFHQICLLVLTYRESPQSRISWWARFALLALERKHKQLPLHVLAHYTFTLSEYRCLMLLMYKFYTEHFYPSTYRFSCFTWSAIFSHLSRLTLEIRASK